MITFIGITAAIAGAFERITSVAAGCACAAVAMKKRRQTYKALSSLDDRTLQDIGLNRTMLIRGSYTDIRRLRDGASLGSQIH